MTDYKAISDLLVKKGKVRGKPVAITLFFDQIPEAYQPIRIEPCGIIHHAMDLGEQVYFDKDHQDCLSGTYTAGLYEGTPALRNGSYLSDNSTFYTPIAAARIKSGSHVLPQGLIRAIGAAPLDDVPEGVPVNWVVVVCNPLNATAIASVRTVVDGVAPRAGWGTSLCAELFSFPWHEDNVIVTPGDMGGRMANKIKPDLLFVVIPTRYLDRLSNLLGKVPHIEGMLDATKPPDSEYWKKKKTRSAKPSRSTSESQPDAMPTHRPAPQPDMGTTATPATSPKETIQAETSAPAFTMPWDEESRALFAAAPPEVQAFAAQNVEDFAREKGYSEITRKVVIEQMESVGLTLEMLTDMMES